MPVLAVMFTVAAAWAGEPARPQPVGGATEARRESASSASVRTWRHPVEWYPSSVRRWFVDLAPQLQYSEARYHRGDDMSWARPALDDDGWEARGFWNLPARAGVNWVRFRVRMKPGAPATLPAGVMVSTVRAYDIFWDGVQLGSSGGPGNRPEAEVPGRVDEWFSVPGVLRGPGEHVVALRTSSYRCGFPASTSGFRILVDSPAELQGKVLREALVPTLAAGALFMTGLASLIMWMLAARRATLLLLGGVCLSGAVMQALQAFRWFFHYPADWHYPVLSVMTSLVGVQGILTVAFVIVHFNVPHRRWLLGGLVPVFVVVSWLSPERLNLEGVWLLAVGSGVSLACAAWAAWRRRRGAWPAVAGVAASTFLLALEAEDYRASFFLKFLPALLGLISSLAVQLHDERRRAQAAQLASARLEIELLKKNIQPHFLLNTLATIMETIEQEPATAAALVDALAGEFRILARVTGEKLIPLAQELELCRAHLRMMSLRQGAKCSLAVHGADERALVPPALFHTLIENGLTHLLPRDGRLDFELQAAPAAGRIRYRLLARGERQPAPDGSATREGTGLRYIKARLEESFTGRWTLAGGPIADGWETVIEIETTAGVPSMAEVRPA